jgi:hypothetical protein
VRYGLHSIVFSLNSFLNAPPKHRMKIAAGNSSANPR